MVDVVIIGAGPAGLAAAKQLVLNGASVVLLDRHTKPGTKACGGGITKSAWLDAFNDMDGLKQISQMVVKTKIGKTKITNNHSFMVIVNRQKWANQKLEELLDLGCIIKTGQTLKSFNENFVFTKSEKIGFRKLIGADGVSSIVRRKLGLPRAATLRAWQLRISLQEAENIKIKTTMPTVWFQPEKFGSGYGWAFPLQNEIKIGLGVPIAAMSAHQLKITWMSWLKQLQIDTKNKKLETGSIGCNFVGYKFNNVFLAGDAGGFASPVTGEGIGQALISGKEIATEIIDPNYSSKQLSLLLTKHRRTFDLLNNKYIGKTLLNMAPVFLKFNWLKNKTFKRYVF